MVLRFIKICQFLWLGSPIQAFNILASPCFQHFFILFFKIHPCADTLLEPCQTSRGTIIWSFPFRAEFPRLFSVTASEAAVRRCTIKIFAKSIGKHLWQSLFDAIFLSYWNTKSKQRQRYEKSSSLLQMSKLCYLIDRQK